MSNSNLTHFAQRWLIPSTIVGLMLALGAVNNLFGTVTAIKGGYVLIGTILAGVAFYTTVDANDYSTLPPANTSERRLGITVLIICSLSIAFAALAHSRLAVLVLTLPLGYLFLIIQMRSRTAPRWYLLQVGALFFTTTISKVLTVGYYFGNGDVIGHIKSIEKLIQTGSLTAISSPVYQQLPGLHVLTGAIKLVTGLATHDSLLLLGTLVYLGLTVVLFVTVRSAGASERLAVCVVLAMTILGRVLFYTTYFFPQSLATAFVVLLIFIAFRIKTGNTSRLSFTAVIIGSILVFTHHLTLVLFVPFIFVFFLVYLLYNLNIFQKHTNNIISMPNTFPIVITGISAIAYWILYNLFIGQFIYATNSLILENTLIASDTADIVTSYTIGAETSLQSSVTAILSLFTPTGIYFISVVSVLIIGMLETFSFDKEYERMLTLISAGVVSAPLVLKTPLAISQRIALPGSFFFAVIVGIGIRRLLRARSRPIYQRYIPIFVLIILCVTGPMAAADDVSTLNSGPNFYGKTTAPDAQSTLTNQELEELQSASHFLHRNDNKASSFWFTSVVMKRFGADVRDAAMINETNITSRDEIFVYRQKWPQYQINFRGARNQLLISRSSLDSILLYENEIYTTGQIGLLWDRSKTFNSTH